MLNTSDSIIETSQCLVISCFGKYKHISIIWGYVHAACNTIYMLRAHNANANVFVSIVKT